MARKKKSSTFDNQGMASSSNTSNEQMITKDITPHPSAAPILTELQSIINKMFQVVAAPILPQPSTVVNEIVKTQQNTVYPWNTLFKGNRLIAKGTSLKFVAPAIKNGVSVACLDKYETDKLSKIWATSLVIYVVGVIPSIGALTRYIEKEWKSVAKPIIFLHDDGFCGEIS